MVAHDLTTTLDRLLSAERTVVYADDRSVASVASETKRIFMPLLELIQVYSTQDCQTLCMSKQKGSALIISGARHSRETVVLIHILQLYKTYTFCITSEHGSECALAADDTLYVGTTRADVPPRRDGKTHSARLFACRVRLSVGNVTERRSLRSLNHPKCAFP
jgi:hypothetical protein